MTTRPPSAPRRVTARRRPAFRDWLAPAGLLLLAVIPLGGGAVRVMEIAADQPPTPENARFLADPVTILVHIAAASLYAVLGALQHARPLRRGRRIRWHRRTGLLLVPMGFVVAGTGAWMVLAYEMPPLDRGLLDVSRMVVSVAMALFLTLAIRDLRRHDYRGHGAWMTRAYALALGAGTQAFTHLPFPILGLEVTQLGRLLAMDAGWLINAVVAEVVIRRRRR
ncbi:DUF2306 domain-containing protein [Georgenia deserti]|uniref:DUF2306 domain-containing protein n=1 Tax=Georgenia deserti TaxID=2093781 RepID=A0ABW4L8E4_9MICO